MESYCKKCSQVTQHKQHLQEAKDNYPNTFWGGVKKYIVETLLIGENTDMALKKLDEQELVLTCTSCGNKKVENQATELQ